MPFPAKSWSFVLRALKRAQNGLWRPLTKHEISINSVILAAGLFALSIISISPAHADISRPIDVISISWPNAPQLTTSVTTARKEIQNYTIPYWKSHAGISFTRGMDSASPIKMTSEVPCNGDATVNYMNLVASKFYSSQGLNSANRYLFILTPLLSQHCVWQAKSIIGDVRISFGISILQDNASPLVITHELGHALGLGHTNLMKCPTTSDSNWADCENIEYAGGIDLMSNIEKKGPLNIYHLWRLGKIDSPDIHSILESGTTNLNPIGLGSGTRGLFIHDGDAIYWIEFRPAEGEIKSGLAVYRTDSPNLASGTSSPNPEYSGHYVGDTSGDVWLLNLDNYNYSAKPTGSPTTFNFTTISGNVTISAENHGTYLSTTAIVKDPSRLQPMPATPPDLSAYTFSTSDFGSNYEIEPVDNPNSLKDPTLQICNGNFPSESHRVNRYQVAANPVVTSKYTFISSEAVQYDSPYWANQALKEVDASAAKCSVKIAKIKMLSSRSLKGVNSRNLISTSMVKNSNSNLLASFYVRGNMMVGVYVISKYNYGNSELDKWLKISDKIGSRLS